MFSLPRVSDRTVCNGDRVIYYGALMGLWAASVFRWLCKGCLLFAVAGYSWFRYLLALLGLIDFEVSKYTYGYLDKSAFLSLILTLSPRDFYLQFGKMGVWRGVCIERGIGESGYKAVVIRI